jgi:hypothetical protein
MQIPLFGLQLILLSDLYIGPPFCRLSITCSLMPGYNSTMETHPYGPLPGQTIGSKFMIIKFYLLLTLSYPIQFLNYGCRIQGYGANTSFYLLLTLNWCSPSTRLKLFHHSKMIY